MRALALAGALALPVAASAGRAYVSNEGDGTVSVLDTTRGVVIGTIGVGKRPRGLALSRDGSRLYVAVSGVPRCPPAVSHAECARMPRDLSADGVAVVDTRKLERIAQLSAGSDPIAIALSHSERTLFVANEDASAVCVVDLRSGTILTHIHVPRAPQALRMSPNDAWVGVASDAERTFSLIDSHLLESLIRQSVGRRPEDFAFSPDGRNTYVADELGGAVYRLGVPSGSGAGPALRLSAPTKLAQLPQMARPSGIALDPSRRRLYVTTGRQGTVAVIALDDPRHIAEIRVGALPRAPTLSPNERWLFAADAGSADVSVIDTITLRVVARIRVGRAPWGLAVGQ